MSTAGLDQKRLFRLALLGALLEPRAAAGLLSTAKQKLRELRARDPMDAVVATVLLGGLAFYVAERGKNPKVNSLEDALVYFSTSLSAGTSEIFARTPLGKMIGTAALTWGPALKAGVFDAPAASQGTNDAASESLALQRETLHKLEQILLELRAGRA